MPRIVSLIASATEIVAALGMTDRIVGRSHECDYPPEVRDLPICTEPKFDVEGSSDEIDRRVKSILQDAASVYRVHTDVLESLQPDIIITQAQCEVCAVSLNDVEAALCDLLSCRPKVVSLEPNNLADVFRDIRSVAAALDIESRGEEVVANLRARIDAIRTQTESIARRPTVACVEWLSPLMAAGNWMPELVTLAGGTNLFGVAGAHAPWMQWLDLVAADPDILLALPCGYDIAKTRSEMYNITNKTEWSDLKAVRQGQVYLTDGNQYFNRPGPRLVESLEILAEIFHPDRFSFGHEGRGWERWPANTPSAAL